MSTVSSLVKLSTEGKWQGGVKSEIFVRDFATIVMDEPVELGGADEGPNPMEFVLAALSGCTSVMISLIAQEKDFKFKNVDFKNTGILDLRGLKGVEGVSPHFQKVRFDVIFDTEESDERIEELKQEVERRCPVYNLIKDSGAEIQAKWYRKSK